MLPVGGLKLNAEVMIVFSQPVLKDLSKYFARIRLFLLIQPDKVENSVYPHFREVVTGQTLRVNLSKYVASG